MKDKENSNMPDKVPERKNILNRREFLKTGLRSLALLSLAGVGVKLLRNSISQDEVWQIDPDKCTQCGKCATACVLNPSAVKCVHVYQMCGYCNLCGGYFQPSAKELNTAAESQLCPTKAIHRTFIEDPYYQYTIDESLCIGCAKCVKGCGSFGNGSLHLQIRHNICVRCNQCAIAQVCPSDAIVKVPQSQPYLFKTGNK